MSLLSAKKMECPFEEVLFSKVYNYRSVHSEGFTGYPIQSYLNPVNPGILVKTMYRGKILRLGYSHVVPRIDLN